jgi:hypothetical protein
MLPLGSKNKWQLYKSCASQSGLKGTEVVAETTMLPIGEINVHNTGVTIEEIIVVTNEFNVDTFAENIVRRE